MLKERIKIKIFIGTALLILVTGCVKSKRPGLPQQVRTVIDHSGINRTEFLKAIVQYQRPEDSLKQKALYFLIANMGSHYYATCKYVDTAGRTIHLASQKADDSQLFKEYIQLLKQQTGGFKVVRDSFFLDLQYINHQLLSEAIDHSFQYWKHPLFPGKPYSFGIYCRYILPYRVDNEPLEDFYPLFDKTFGDDIKKFNHKPRTLTALAGFIHFLVEDTVKYESRFEYECDLPDMHTLLKRGQGNYRQISILEAKVLRNFGIAATMDYAPYLADTAGGYYWPVLFFPDGNFSPILHQGKKGNFLTKPGKFPKIFRRIYEEDSSSLYHKKEMSYHTPYFIGNFNYQDVTDYYIPTKDIRVKFNQPAPYGYLSVFNNGQWQPVHWAELAEDSTALFKKMGLNIIYLPVVYTQKDLVKAAGLPFILNANGKVELSDQSAKPRGAVLTAINNFTPLQPKTTYFLYRWEMGKWSLEKLYQADKSGMIKVKLKTHTLYLLSTKHDTSHFSGERIFIINQGGNQMFY